MWLLALPKGGSQARRHRSIWLCDKLRMFLDRTKPP